MFGVRRSPFHSRFAETSPLRAASVRRREEGTKARFPAKRIQCPFRGRIELPAGSGGPGDTVYSASEHLGFLRQFVRSHVFINSGRNKGSLDCGFLMTLHLRHSKQPANICCLRDRCCRTCQQQPSSVRLRWPLRYGAHLEKLRAAVI